MLKELGVLVVGHEILASGLINCEWAKSRR